MPDIQTIGVVGAGTMGHGIAHVAATAGFHVVLYDTKLELAQKGKSKIAENLDVGVKKGKVTAEAREKALSQITVSEGLVDLGRSDLVIEAIPEDIGLKRK